MKSNIASAAVALFAMLSVSVSAQSVFPGKETIDKKELSGLTLSQGIQDKYLSNYWESYLSKYGKVKGKKGIYSIEKAGITSISPNAVQLTSQVASVNKTLSKVFIALNADGSYVTSENEQSYKAAEQLLKDFSDYAAASEQVRLADEMFSTSEKNHQKLQKQIEETNKDIEKTEKKLTELRAELEKGKTDSQTSMLDLQNKQKALEAAKVKVPALK
ncbi:MAG TPA: hypothetical protein VGN64_06345 [Dyadobacter sp.]|jgi:hypothetical protein|nr:hypothetical protein [Dyadobacter sp.]